MVLQDKPAAEFSKNPLGPKVTHLKGWPQPQGHGPKKPATCDWGVPRQGGCPFGEASDLEVRSGLGSWTPTHLGQVAKMVT